MSEQHDDDSARDIFGELIPTTGADNALSFTNELTAGLGNVAMSISSAGTGSGLPFLGLSRTGHWKFGPEDLKADLDARLAVDLRSIRHGYSCWDDGKLLGEVLVSAAEKLPSLHELPDHGAKWEMAISVEMVFLDGEDEHTKVLYKNSSLGGRKAVMALIEQVKRQVRVDPSKPVPIIKLNSTSYDHKKYGEIFQPIFDLVGFTDGRSAPVAPAPKTPTQPPATEAVAPSGRGRKAEPEPAPTRKAEPETAGRRRRVS